jgi:hypothetical protein
MFSVDVSSCVVDEKRWVWLGAHGLPIDEWLRGRLAKVKD